MKRSTLPFAVRGLLVGLVVLAGPILLSACGNDEAPETIRFRGSLTYAQDVPLPEKANARVSLIQVADTETAPEMQDGAEAENAGRRIVVEQTLHNLDAKPIAFDLEVGQALMNDAGRYILRAEINNDGGQVLWRTAEPFIVKLDQAGQQSEKIELALVPTPENMGVLSFADFVCEEGFTFAVATQPERAVVRLDDRFVELPKVRSASGAKYSDGQNVYWSKGSESLIRIDGSEHSACLPRKAEASKEGEAAAETPADKTPTTAPETAENPGAAD